MQFILEVRRQGSQKSPPPIGQIIPRFSRPPSVRPGLFVLKFSWKYTEDSAKQGRNKSEGSKNKGILRPFKTYRCYIQHPGAGDEEDATSTPRSHVP